MRGQKVKIVMVGIAGYGEVILSHILDNSADPDIELTAAVARRPERCRRLADLQRRGTKIYTGLEDFFRADTADLAIVSSPIQLHYPFTRDLLAHGINVICEKPVTATVQDALAMAEAAAQSDCFVAIGYQWSFCDAIQALKKDIMAGDLGCPLMLKTIVSWPRPASYYARNDWAGALKTATGEWVLDSPVNNATAHYLHNMFYVLGPTRATSDAPVNVTAELYRANAVPNFDTAALRCRTESGAEILFYSSHAVPSRIGPLFCYDFENATVNYAGGLAGGSPEHGHQVLSARFRNGTVRNYGDPAQSAWNKIWDCVKAVRTGQPVACGIEAATPQILCVNGAQESMQAITDFPQQQVHHDPQTDGDKLTWMEGLQDVMVQCYDQAMLPSETGQVPWAREGSLVDLRNYRRFPQAGDRA